jgi:TolA-binding protein
LYKIDDAIKYYFEYLKSPVSSGEVNPSNAKYNLGYCFLKKENYKQAQTYFEQVTTTSPRINASPFEQDAYIRIADCYYMSRDFKKALSMYDKVIGYSWPASDYATFQKAMVAGVSSGAEKVKLLQTIPRVYPTSSLIADANMEIANSYLSDEKFTQSIPFLKNVATNTVNEALKPKAYLKLGIAYYNANNNKEALNQYNILTDAIPQLPEAEEAFEMQKQFM